MVERPVVFIGTVLSLTPHSSHLVSVFSLMIGQKEDFIFKKCLFFGTRTTLLLSTYFTRVSLLPADRIQALTLCGKVLNVVRKHVNGRPIFGRSVSGARKPQASVGFFGRFAWISRERRGLTWSEDATRKENGYEGFRSSKGR